MEQKTSTALQLTEADTRQLQEQGITREVLEKQVDNFIKGFPFVKLDRPATVGDGIRRMEEAELDDLIASYETASKTRSILKFVPASGAASRMFKALFDFYANPAEGHPAVTTLQQVEKFAFADDIRQCCEKDGVPFDTTTLEGLQRIAGYILHTPGLNYGHLPKGLIKFHSYKTGSRTAFEEHMVEGAVYARGGGDRVKLHFTVSPEHKEAIVAHIDAMKEQYEKQFGVTYEIQYSVQAPATDTVAVDMNNELFREEDGSLLFRPGGHGALINNLNGLDADVIFIKNIDNVVPDRLKDTTYRYKKALGGYLLSLQDTVFSYQKMLDKGVSDEQFAAIRKFLQETLCVEVTTVDEAREKLFRPIRVCGMVKNDGDTGGGPFWIKERNGVSLQIVETAQINTGDAGEQAILEKSTHFNPVDLVCATKNYRGERYDLAQFVNPEMGFISQKSKDGRDLKAQELPGLWNGAMASWTTVFVEVPLITFNPVKAVGDLLEETHQG